MMSIFVSMAIISCSKPVKTVAYFEEHPEEIMIEAKRCVEDAKNKIDIEKDKTCMNVIAIETARCTRKMSFFGNPFGVDCHNPVDMMQLAYNGF